ncbi:MAG: hypothetical protein EA346_03060 [Thioalkalivibrio sp.]|nr:MAG: hypothetical protein EA346_03060 [Thioalkalivibrio sp.]
MAGIFATALLLGGCAGFGEGLVRAVLSQMEGDPEVDTRACEIQGAPFDGILVAIQSQDGQGRIGNAPTSERSVVKVMVDPLVYVGAGRQKILSAIRQSMCWAYSTEWGEFPEAPAQCRQDDPRYGSRLKMDRFFFVTHSLGSRIVLDALETTADDLFAQLDSDTETSPFLTNLQHHTVTVFMLANQLPLLQAGFDPVPVTGQIGAYCMPDAPLYDRRIVARTRVIAFSDPNDLLSYPIPDDFVQYGIDSRLCPTVVNMSLNIARVSRLLARDGFANPLTAHTGYNDDERVIGLMIGGLGRPETPPAVTERCNWIQVEEALR